MSRSVFGWHYPPGAESDPRAPWNQEDEPSLDDLGWTVATLLGDERCECGGSLIAIRDEEPNLEETHAGKWSIQLAGQCMRCGEHALVTREGNESDD